MSQALHSNRTPSFSDAEWAVRVDLAAAYRLIAHFEMDDSIYTHISARVPHDGPAETDPHHFLINPFGMLFGEVTASSLVKIDMDGNIVGDSDYGVNAAGFTIHSAVHMARHDVGCVLHTHTREGVAVSCQRDGLLPLNQWSLQFYNRIAYHDYEGIALDLEERERLIADLGDKWVMILRNHGLVTCGATVRGAFALMYNLNRACKAQIDIQSSGAPVIALSPDVCELTARQYEGSDKFDEMASEPGSERTPGRPNPSDMEWEAFLRRLDPTPAPNWRS
ncbi:MAG: class II aldolase/adducin family protein [Pseudomonadota bacterium]